MYEFAPVGASVLILAVGIGAALRLPRSDPLLSVSGLIKGVILGAALGGPFVLERSTLLSVFGGWDLVVALALSVVLYLLAVRLVGEPSNGDPV